MRSRSAPRVAGRRRKWLRKLAAVSIVGLLVLGGLALAYWTVGGSGSGSGSTGSASSITVNQTASATGLYPGGSSALSGNFTNPNPGKVYVTAVTATITSFSVQADATKPACTQADFSISGTATVGAEINSGAGVGSWSGLSLNMTDAATNQDNCKSITVPITYTST